jgi:hypothetical protein
MHRFGGLSSSIERVASSELVLRVAIYPFDFFCHVISGCDASW